MIVLISYLCILIAILRIPSLEGRHKAFSTCASHLMAVTIFFGTILFMYLRPTSSYSMEQDKIVSVFLYSSDPYAKSSHLQCEK